MTVYQHAPYDTQNLNAQEPLLVPQHSPPSRTGSTLVRVGSELLTQTAGILIIAVTLQIVLPDGAKPSQWLGNAAGDFEAAATAAQTQARVDLERQLAEAQAKAQAEEVRATEAAKAVYQVTVKAAETIAMMQADINKSVQQDITNAQQMKTMGANLSDIGCVASFILPDLPELSGACGMGDRIRKDIVQDRLEISEQALSREFDNLMQQALSPEQMALLGRLTQ